MGDSECDCRLHRVEARNVPRCTLMACSKMAAYVLSSKRSPQTFAEAAQHNDRIYYVLGVIAAFLTMYVLSTD